MQTASFPSTSGWDGVEASLQTGLVVSLRHTPHCSLLPTVLSSTCSGALLTDLV